MTDNEMVIPSDPRFAVRYIPVGGKYGRRDCLTCEGQPRIVFFDTKFKHEGGDPLGQSTGGAYYAADIAKHESGYALSLYGGVPEWTVSARGMEEVRQFLLSR